MFAAGILVLVSACTEKHLPESSITLASKGLHSAAIHPRAQSVVAGSIFQGGSFWRLSDEERLFNWNHTTDEEKSIILFADIASNSPRAITADESTLVLWDTNTGEALRFWTSPAKITDLALMENGRYVALALADQTAVIFDAFNGGIIRTFHHSGKVYSVAASTDQTKLITGSEDKTSVLWDAASGTKLLTINHEEEVQFVALSDDARYVLSVAQYDTAELWDTRIQESIGEIPMKKQQLSLGLQITAASFRSDNQQLLIAYSNRTVELRETTTLQVIDQWVLPRKNQWQPTSAPALDVAFDVQPGIFYAASSDGFLHRLTLRSTH
ncbi:WD40 repeat domain-containing protein [Eionea flava]